MEDHLKVRFAKVLGTTQAGPQSKPDDCPKWMVEAYKGLCAKWSALLGNREANQRDYPLLVLFAELNQQLSARVADLEAIVKSVKPEVAAKVEADFVPTEKIDLRTKEGRALKATAGV